MTHRTRSRRALLVAFGMLLVMGGAARSQDHPADSARDSIIQGVRDDVRRKIRDREAAEYRAESATVGQTSPRIYRPKRAKKQQVSR